MGTPKVRAKLGVDWKNSNLIIVGERGAVSKALHHVANDLAEKKITVRDVMGLDDRIKYVESLPADVAVASSAPTRTRRRTRRRPTATRDRLIHSDTHLNVTDTRIQSIEEELRTLSLQKHPNAVSVLFRVFLELSADAYISRVGLPNVQESSKLSAKMNAVTNDLVANGKLSDQQAVGARQAAQQGSYLGPTITVMHQYVHNPNMFPAPTDLRASWDNLRLWFEAVWGP